MIVRIEYLALNHQGQFERRAEDVLRFMAPLVLRWRERELHAQMDAFRGQRGSS